MKIAVIGGGAAGITAAIFAKRANKENRVTVFERSDRILRKLLATGNGRCNLSNADISERHYFSHSGEYINQILSAFTPSEERQFFESIGILFCEENGRIYPYSRRANSVADALRFECEHLGVEIRTNSFIEKITKKDGAFIISGEVFDKLIIAGGGISAPSFGTDGNAFRLLKSMGHTITPCSYALAPLKVKENTASLKGIRAHAALTLSGGKESATEYGELQFTDYGLSGIAVMQLSRRVRENDIISADLMTEYTEEELTSFLKTRRETLSHLKTPDFLSGILHKTLAQYILACSGVQCPLAGNLSDKDISLVCKKIKQLSFTVSSVLGKEHSQATCGGASLEEFSPVTLESKKCPGLYAVGESLDCIGDCGGYNLHWAWTTAKIAGSAMYD